MKIHNSKKKICVVLPDIRSVHNVASIFRTADCFGVSEIFLVGYTPGPLDRFGRERKDFVKVSLGAEKFLSWRHFQKIDELFNHLKKENYFILAIEQSQSSVDYREVKMRYPLALIFGNEVGGIDSQLLNRCDAIGEIPMLGTKESLNVSVAVGVVLARFAK